MRILNAAASAMLVPLTLAVVPSSPVCAAPFEGKPFALSPRQLLEQAAQQAVTLSDYSEPSSLHTLATIYAEIGRVVEARDVLLALIGTRTGNELDSPDWYVLGRLAEHYGADETARDSYRKVTPPEPGQAEATSTHKLASRRLSALAER